MSARRKRARESGSGVPPLSPEVGRVAPNAPWPVVPFGSTIVRIETGKSFKCEERPPREGETGVAKVSAVTWGTYDEQESKTCLDSSRINKQILIHPGDFLFTRANTINLVGACVIAHATTRRVMLSDKILRFIFTEDVEPKWVLHWLRSRYGRAEIESLSTGNQESMRNIGQDRVRQIKLPLPPLPEQRRIVAEIETQWAKLDAGVAALKRVQANLKRYRAAVLKAACEGKLVPTEAELTAKNAKSTKTKPRSLSASSALSAVQSPEFETGEQFLQRILAERRKQAKVAAASRRSAGEGKRRDAASTFKYKEPVVPDTSNLPPIPEGWTWASVDALTGHITSGSRDWSQYYGKGKGTFVLAQNVRPLKLDMAERQTVDAPAGDAETERTRVVQNDLLVTIVGAKTGDVCRVPHELNDHFVCQSVGLLRPVSASTARYLELYLASPENGQAIWKRFIYGQGRPHLGFDELRATAVALPPLAEQTRIVAQVERRLSVIDELEALVATNLARATRLRLAVLQQAFNG